MAGNTYDEVTKQLEGLPLSAALKALGFTNPFFLAELQANIQRLGEGYGSHYVRQDFMLDSITQQILSQIKITIPDGSSRRFPISHFGEFWAVRTIVQMVIEEEIDLTRYDFQRSDDDDDYEWIKKLTIVPDEEDVVMEDLDVSPSPSFVDDLSDADNPASPGDRAPDAGSPDDETSAERDDRVGEGQPSGNIFSFGEDNPLYIAASAPHEQHDAWS